MQQAKSSSTSNLFFISLPPAFRRLVVISARSVQPLTHSGGSTMDILQRARGIIMTPKTEWPVIAAEQPNPAEIF
jgi:hypothetical protein